MGQTLAPKQGHEQRGEGMEAFIKRLEGGFAGERIADQHRDKIDQIVATKPSARKAESLRNCFKPTQMRKHLSKHSHLAKPGGG